MCSLNDPERDGEMFMAPETPLDRKEMFCRKCNKEGQVVLRKKDVYCKECFLLSSTHKFRATLGKSKIMKPKDKVLVAFSGSQYSLALLHFIRTGLDEPQHRKLFFDVVVLFIEEGAILGITDIERLKVIDYVKQKVHEFKFPLYIASLGSCMNKDNLTICNADDFKINKQDDEELMKLFNDIKSLTSKEDMLCRLRQNIFTKSAIALQCSKIFTAEIGTDLAVKLLSSISIGRGNQLPLEVGFCDARHPDMKLLRPMRDFTKKEISFYNFFNDLESIFIPSLTTKLPPDVSIRKLTEKFITDLQEDFPSTVYTIFRTGDKLSSSGNASNSDDVCLLCKGLISEEKVNYNAIEDTRFSKNISEHISDSSKKNVEKSSCCAENNDDEVCCGTCKVVNSSVEKSDVAKYFCYGCNLIIRDMNEVEHLPKDILAAAVEKKNFEVMKNQISEFLL